MAYSKEYGRQYYLRNKERIGQRSRQYYLENKERVCQRVKQYQLENHEQICQDKRQYRQDYPEVVKKQECTRYLKHGEKMLAKSKQRYVDHRHERIEHQRVYALERTPEVVRKTEMKKEQWGKRNRKALNDQLLQIYGSKCACCGESNRVFLTLDHINGDGNAERKALKNRQGGCLGKAIREPDKSKYQILCYNCNYGKQRNKGVCPHKSHT